MIFFKNNHNKNILFSNDNESEVLEKASLFIPNNYEDVYKYFDGIRAMIHSKTFNADQNRLQELKSENTQLKAELQKTTNLLEKYKASM